MVDPYCPSIHWGPMFFLIWRLLLLRKAELGKFPVNLSFGPEPTRPFLQDYLCFVGLKYARTCSKLGFKPKRFR